MRCVQLYLFNPPPLLLSSSQLIQTISAVDTDEPLVGHKFVFTISPTNPNFTIVDREGETRARVKIFADEILWSIW